MSESLFFVRPQAYDIFGYSDPRNVVNTCSFSSTAILFAIFHGSLMTCAALVLSARRFSTNMPISGNCSAAISAACHPPADNKDAALKPVMWGEIPVDHGGTGSISGTLDETNSGSRGERAGDYLGRCKRQLRALQFYLPGSDPPPSRNKLYA